MRKKGDRHFFRGRYALVLCCEALLTVVGAEPKGNPLCVYVRLKGLFYDKIYSVNGDTYTGAALMNAGFKIPPMRGDYPVGLFYFKIERSVK
jgi:alpha-galactosidase